MKRPHAEEHENHERWLVSYADFITLLFAFFTVLYATSQQDAEKAKQFEDSIRKHLSGLTQMGGGANGGQGVIASRQALESPVQALPDPRSSVHAVEAMVAEYLEKNIPKEDQARTVANISTDTNGVRIRLHGSARFAAGSIALTPKLQECLSTLAGLLKESGRQVIIEGHAYNEKSPSLPTLWELSSLRATQVARVLIEKYGVPQSQISAQGYSDQRAISSTSNAVVTTTATTSPGTSIATNGSAGDIAAAANRRVDIYILNKESGE